MSEFLLDEGYRVFTARNGAEAAKIVLELVPSLVILDMRMPILDGWGCAALIQERSKKIPILVMTAAQRWASEVGAEGYLSKSFDLTDLLKTVESVMQRY